MQILCIILFANCLVYGVTKYIFYVTVHNEVSIVKLEFKL